jgi:hypothetical protein
VQPHRSKAGKLVCLRTITPHQQSLHWLKWLLRDQQLSDEAQGSNFLSNCVGGAMISYSRRHPQATDLSYWALKSNRGRFCMALRACSYPRGCILVYYLSRLMHSIGLHGWHHFSARALDKGMWLPSARPLWKDSMTPGCDNRNIAR